jgi:hypothetical protein
MVDVAFSSYAFIICLCEVRFSSLPHVGNPGYPTASHLEFLSEGPGTNFLHKKRVPGGLLSAPSTSEIFEALDQHYFLDKLYGYVILAYIIFAYVIFGYEVSVMEGNPMHPLRSKK